MFDAKTEASILYNEMCYNKIIDEVYNRLSEGLISYEDVCLITEEAYSNYQIAKLVAQNDNSKKTQIQSEAQAFGQTLINQANKLKAYISSNVAAIIKKINEYTDINVKSNLDIKQELTIVNKVHAEMNGLKNYKKPTSLSKGTFVIANIVGWVPPLTLVPGSVEITYGALQIGNFLADFKRIWNEECCSAVQDYVNMVRSQRESQLNAEVNTAKSVNDLTKFMNAVKSHASSVFEAILRLFASTGREIASKASTVSEPIGGAVKTVGKGMKKIENKVLDKKGAIRYKGDTKGDDLIDISNKIQRVGRKFRKDIQDSKDAVNEINAQYKRKKGVIRAIGKPDNDELYRKQRKASEGDQNKVLRRAIVGRPVYPMSTL